MANEMEHAEVYYRPDEYAGWPFMHGLWKNGADELLLAFKRTRVSYGDANDIHHDRLTVKATSETVVAKSSDKAKTWQTDDMVKLWDFTTSETEAGARPRSLAGLLPLGGVDFADPDVLIAGSSTPTYGLTEARPWIRVSTDGGSSWLPPILLDNENFPAVSGNGSSMVRADGVSLLFLTAISVDGWIRRPMVYAYSEEAMTWRFLSMITPKRDDGAADGNWTAGSLRFGGHRWFYPRGIQTIGGKLLCSLRCQRDPRGIMWTEIYESDDGGRTWGFLSRVNDWGAPGDITQMRDGRTACVYGYRLPPFGIRARISEDGGRTWESEIVLRDDGGSWDLGYPRVIELEPGTLFAAYYFNRKDDPVQANGGVRHIAQTVFKPD